MRTYVQSSQEMSRAQDVEITTPETEIKQERVNLADTIFAWGEDKLRKCL